MMRRHHAEPKPPAKAEATPHAALRAFEAKLFGDNAVYHEDKIEDGHGSLFQGLSAENKAHHAALRAVVEAETAHKAAVEALDVATAKLKAAVDAAAVTAKAIE